MVSVPHDMVSMIVAKAINMTKKMDVEVIGVIENMSYIKCPDCGKTIRMFNGNTKEFLDDMGIRLLGELPMTQEIAQYGIGKSDEINTMFEKITDEIVGK
jgi:Mrp family chromosome partitioning ATPase